MAFTIPKADREAARNDPTVREALRETTTMPEILAGSPPGRIVGGVVPGIAELAAGAVGYGPEAAELRGKYEKAKHKGQDWWSAETHGLFRPSDEPDVLGMAGEVLGAKKFLPAPLTTPTKGFLKSAGQGLGVGAISGALEPTGPVETPADWYMKKFGQAGFGGVFGAGIPLVTNLGVGAVNLGRNIVGRTPELAKRLLAKAQQKMVGEPHIDAVKNAMRNVQELVPGSKPTVAEGLVGTPQGSPIAAHQRQIAAKEGGPSAQFGMRWDEKDAARRTAEGLLTPTREYLLREANTAGGIPTMTMLASLDVIEKSPGVRANQPLVNAIKQVREKIGEQGWSTAGTGPGAKRMRMDAQDVYTLRESLARTQEQAGDAAVSGVYQQAITVLDNAIGRAAPEWSRYLSLQARQSARIAADLERQGAMYRPSQVTHRGGEPQATEEEIKALPGLMDWHFSVGNYLLGMIRGKIEPEIERQAALQYLDPKEFAKSLDRHPDIIIPDVWKQLFLPAEVATGKAGGDILTKKAKAAAEAMGATDLPSPVPPRPPRAAPPAPPAAPASAPPAAAPTPITAPQPASEEGAKPEVKPPAARPPQKPEPEGPGLLQTLKGTEGGRTLKQALSALSQPWGSPVDIEGLQASPAGQELQGALSAMGLSAAPAQATAATPPPAKPTPAPAAAPTPPAAPPRISAPPKLEKLKAIQNQLNTEQKRNILRLAQLAQSDDPKQKRAAEDELRIFLVKSLKPLYPGTDAGSIKELLQDTTDFQDQLVRTNYPQWSQR